MKVHHLLAVCIALISLIGCKTNKVSSTAVNNSREAKSVFINGDSLHYIDIGKGDPVIFIHGALGDYRGFQGQLDTFSQSHRVIVYSRRYAYPDFGAIKDSLNYGVAIHVEDLTQFIQKLNLAPAHLVGHSYGAIIALQTALAHPELVRTATLCEAPYASLFETKGGVDTLFTQFDNNYRFRAGEAFMKNENEKGVAIFVQGVLGDGIDFTKFPPDLKNRMLSNVPETRAIAITKSPFPKVTCDELKKVKTPILIVGGDKSPKFFAVANNELNNCLPNRELAILANTSHGLPNENPTAFNKIALPFINKH